MAELSKTARASMAAGMVREAKKDPFDTSEKKINELRKQRVDKLFVNRMDFVDALLAEYDKALLALAQEAAAYVASKIVLEQATEQLKRMGEEQEGSLGIILDLRSEVAALKHDIKLLEGGH